jgi:hypothetical protein
MKRIRIIGSALVAVLALSAVGASAASAALPEFTPSTGVKLTGTAGAGLLETVTGTKVTCTASTNSGEITGVKTVSKVKVKFTGCESTGAKCNTTGAAVGELVTEELKATLGYLNAAKKEVGLDFVPVGTKFIEFSCGTALVGVKVTGSVICRVTPVNVKSATATVTCKQSKGIQEFTKFEGGETAVLKTQIGIEGLPQQSGEETTATVTATPEAEIKA